MPSVWEAPVDVRDAAEGVHVSVLAAWRRGARAVLLQPLAWLAAVAVAGFALGASLLLVLPALAVGPLLVWGAVRFALGAVDDHPMPGDVLDGLRRVRRALGPAIGLAAVYGLGLGAVHLGTLLLQRVPVGLGLDHPATHLLAAITALSVQLAVSLGVVGRLIPLPFLVVERGLGVVEAVGTAWRATRPHTRAVVGFQLVDAVASLVLLAPGALALGAVGASGPSTESLLLAAAIATVSAAALFTWRLVRLAATAALWRQLAPSALPAQNPAQQEEPP